jgi:hypothetical protein
MRADETLELDDTMARQVVAHGATVRTAKGVGAWSAELGVKQLGDVGRRGTARERIRGDLLTAGPIQCESDTLPAACPVLNPEVDGIAPLRHGLQKLRYGQTWVIYCGDNPLA